MLSLTLGCMYAGKTSCLIRDIPKDDFIIVDYDEKEPHFATLTSHDNISVPCIKTNDLSKINVSIFDTILINEGQFFKNIVGFVKECLEHNKTVKIYGLDGDFKQEMFGEVVQLIPMCDSYVKLFATCKCGKKASFSKRLSDNREQYSPNDLYEPCCRQCL